MAISCTLNYDLGNAAFSIASRKMPEEIDNPFAALMCQWLVKSDLKMKVVLLLAAKTDQRVEGAA